MMESLTDELADKAMMIINILFFSLLFLCRILNLGYHYYYLRNNYPCHINLDKTMADKMM